MSSHKIGTILKDFICCRKEVKPKQEAAFLIDVLTKKMHKGLQSINENSSLKHLQGMSGFVRCEIILIVLQIFKLKV